MYQNKSNADVEFQIYQITGNLNLERKFLVENENMVILQGHYPVTKFKLYSKLMNTATKNLVLIT